MRRRYLILVSILSVMCLRGFSQSQETLDKIEAAKIGLITERLNLTPEQAEKFWPIYKEFTNQQRALRNEFRQLKESYNPETSTEQQNQELLALGLSIKEKQVDLEKTYSQRMQEVITSRQLLSLRKAESDFKEMLIQRIRNQRAQQNQNERRLRNEELLNKRRNN